LNENTTISTLPSLNADRSNRATFASTVLCIAWPDVESREDFPAGFDHGTSNDVMFRLVDNEEAPTMEWRSECLMIAAR